MLNLLPRDALLKALSACSPKGSLRDAVPLTSLQRRDANGGCGGKAAKLPAPPHSFTAKNRFMAEGPLKGPGST